MMRHETERLWALAADELDLEDKRFVELHLSECPECRDSLEAVRVARRALEQARASSPSLAWAATDARVGSLVERRLRAVARPRWLARVVGGALVTAAALVGVGVWTGSAAPVEAPPLQPPMVQLAEPQPVRVESARGLTRIGSGVSPVLAGELLQGGDVLKTGVAGKAFVRLPDASHVRIAAATQLALTRASVEDIALTLSRGRVAIRASHEARRTGFVVHAGDLTVHVVGTNFTVENEPSRVEVGVAEGEVKVTSADGKPMAVRAGQRLVVDARTGRPKLGMLTTELERELSEVQGVAEAVSEAEQQAPVIAAKGGRAPRSTLLPRLTEQEAKARQVTLEPQGPAPAPPQATPTDEPTPRERVDGPGTVFPSLAGGSSRGVPLPRESPAPVEDAPVKGPEGAPSDEREWLPLPPAPAANPAAPMVAQTRAEKPRAKSLEELFLEKAQASLETGGCARYLVGLEDIATDDTDAAQVARVLRARCFEAELRPRQAMAEYAKYLEAYPSGRFAEEARAALGR